MAEACAGWTDKSGNHHDCQFGDEAADHQFDGKDFCRFHLPMGKPGEGGKVDWDNDQQAAISNAIIDRIKAEIEKPEKQRGELDFQGVVVPGELSLEHHTIWLIRMRDAQFHGDVRFDKVQFHGGAQFDGALFHSAVMFNAARFLGPTGFGKAQFNGLAVFGGALFSKDAAFGKANFSKDAAFGNAHFAGITAFHNAQFHGDALFGGAQFNEGTVFAGAKFHGQAVFGGAQFHGDALFAEAQFHGEAQFGEAQFREGTVFGGAQFHGGAVFRGRPNPVQPEVRQFYYTSFPGAQFGGRADFSNREFCDHTNFSGSVFKRAPNFHGSTLHQDTAFGGIECFPDVTSDGADRAYRTLRQAMAGHRARAEEGMFYTLEQRARRRKMRRFDPAFWMSLGYEFGSNYGFSVVLPFAWFFGGIFASTFLLLQIGIFSGAGTDLAAMWDDGWLFSIRQTFLPFDALRSKDNILAAYAFNPGGTGWLRLWGVALTLFEGLSALLLVLAVRWRYRR